MRPVVAIIQARMGSERLPGKVLLDIGGQSMLERVVRRVQQARLIDDVVVATSTNPADDRIAAAAQELGLSVSRGSEEDVLGRFQQAATETHAATIVRICADSPFIDPRVTDRVVEALLGSDADYASIKLEPTYPLGLDVEAFTREALTETARDATEPFERAHVTAFMYMNPERFTLLPVTGERDLHSWRWTVDTAEDLEFARAMFERLSGGNDFSFEEAVAVVEKDPSIALINESIAVKPITAG
jgi:spore coat polysaccharide biosynthesis protein SpsF (cytidylyltransferase family)